MSVLIKNMDMPKNCAECKLWSICECLNDFEDFESVCYAVEDGDLIRDKNCPLVEIPTPHGRLIDVDKLMRDIEEYHLSDGKFQHWVDVQQTIIETEGSE